MARTSAHAAKARRVVDLIRGLPADQAQAVLAFAPQSASDPVGKGWPAPIANGGRQGGARGPRHARGVRRAWVDEGPTSSASGRAPRAAATGS